jgi:hypothetical protein
MSRYTTKDEIASFEFHDSIIKSISFNGSDMKWEIKSAIVIGNSCPEIPNRKINSLNLGEDRYAEPIFGLTFNNYKIVSLERGGCYTLENNIQTEIYPPKYLDREEFISVLQDVANDNGNTVYSMNINDNDGKSISFEFFGGTDPQYYTIELLTDRTVEEWDMFGKEAWYLERYRLQRGSEK